ncbi:MAG TPA: helix-turn-helix domain-containing protein [Phycisphaerales bacterium]|nr:helix-turn-helix domain-containing protein [Phycisphaerales bacterium]
MAEQRHQAAPAQLTEPDVLTFAEACRFLRIGRQLAWQLVNRGELPGFRVGRLWRFRRSVLIDWMQERETNGGAR